MNAITLVLAVVAILIVGLLVAAATKPGTFRLQRSIAIDAPPESIFPLINDLHAHEAWNPFDQPDPTTTKIHSGSPLGAGAVYEWNGKGPSGSGRISILQADPSSRIAMQLDMLAPLKASNEVIFTLAPMDGSTHLTWFMQGPVPYPAKVMHTLFNMDRMVGKQFEAGLATLKRIVENNR